MQTKKNFMHDNFPEATLKAFKQNPLQIYVRLIWWVTLTVVIYNWATYYHGSETEQFCYVRELKQPKGSSKYVLVKTLAESSAEDINVSSNFNYIAFLMYG
jgi:hypothetical protein